MEKTAEKTLELSTPVEQDHHYETTPEDRLSVGQKLTYGIGGFANNVLGAASGGMMIALNLGLKMDPGLIGLLGAIPRVTDALTDPVMGYISDNTRSKWGRRRPYIFAGSIFCGILFTLLWCIPSKEATTFLFWDLPALGADGHGRDMFYFWYFLVGSLLFFLSYTVWVTPWVALGYELTPDYHERTRVMGYSNFIGNFAWLITPWFLPFMQLPYFGSIMKGATVLALLISIMVVACGVISAIFLRERFNEGMEKRDEVIADLQEKAGPSLWDTIKDFFKGFAATIKFVPFLKLCAVAFLVFNGFMMVASFTTYVLIYYVCNGDEVMGAKIGAYGGTVGAVCTFGIVILVTKLGTHFGKKKAFYITTGISVFGYLSKWILFTPSNPWLSLIAFPSIAFGFAGLFPLVGSMIADVCDLDELESFKRREGMFGSIFWWVIKVGMAVALAAGGYLLVWTGFDVELPAQTEQAIFRMRVMDVVVPAATSALAIWVMSRFELTEEKAHEVRLQLEARKKQNS